jgi:hypothetical protein
MTSSYNVVSEVPTLDCNDIGRISRPAIVISIQGWNKILVDTNLEMITIRKQMSHRGWQNRVRISVNREKKNPSMVSASFVVINMWKESWIAVQLNQNFPHWNWKEMTQSTGIVNLFYDKFSYFS